MTFQRAGEIYLRIAAAPGQQGVGTRVKGFSSVAECGHLSKWN